MKNPTEQEILDTIETISRKLAYKFKFGYHELEDMKQQISVFALEGIRNYDHERPLENFLWTHVRNRLSNFKRDNYQRTERPCTNCPLRNAHCANPESDCTEYINKLDCDLYKKWFIRNNSKKNLMYLNSVEELQEYISSNIENHETLELFQTLDKKLFGEHREIYLKIRTGSKVYKNDFKKLIKKIKELIQDE